MNAGLTIRRRADRVSALGLEVNADGETELPCHDQACSGRMVADLNANLARCGECGSLVTADAVLKALEAARRPATRPVPTDPPGEIVTFPVPPYTIPEAPKTRGTDRAPPRCGPPSLSARRLTDEQAPGPHPRGRESWLIGLFAVVFLMAGLMAAGLSGFANHQAFGAMVDDPMQARVWAWTGVVASVASFAGFTFVYWHWRARRWAEGGRALIFALAGALTSVVGTWLFMETAAAGRVAEARAAERERPLIEARIEDWRRQLDGIPAQIRSVEGLEAYLAEVERVGRTDHKPYRDARNELGLARRRAELEARIADATQSLVALARESGSAGRESPLPAWFFAVMLEIFSSQATAIGGVALLILTGGSGRPREDGAEEAPPIRTPSRPDRLRQPV